MGNIVFSDDIAGMRGFDDAVDKLRYLGYNVTVGYELSDSGGFDYIVDSKFPGFYGLKGAVEPIFVKHYKELMGFNAFTHGCSLRFDDSTEEDECWT